MRGTFNPVNSAKAFSRFIPARAGNVADGKMGNKRGTVHPRSCGERAESVGMGIDGAGSSPLVRGTCAILTLQLSQMRFIPARAGNVDIYITS